MTNTNQTMARTDSDNVDLRAIILHWIQLNKPAFWEDLKKGWGWGWGTRSLCEVQVLQRKMENSIAFSAINPTYEMKIHATKMT